ALRDLSPERWLKNSVLELHRLFSGFNGNMMASLVILLIHDNSGYTVMVNAEHPQAILLRNGKACFISHHEGLRKLGNTAVRGRLWVDTFVLQKDDIVILGSDGRDDIIIGYDADKQPIINQDEMQILKIVEATAGDLPRMFLSLKNIGEIADDISLLRVVYQGRPPRAGRDRIAMLWQEYRSSAKAQQPDILRRILEIDPEETRAWRALLRDELRKNNLLNAAFYAECLVRICPQRDLYLYACALLYFRNRNLEKALVFADRLTLRNWKVERYLILLGKIHEARQDAAGMREAGLLLQELVPNHPYGQKLLDLS
ncbi:MAG: serine/threonine-protein phosphatase, partial [Turneriella sp.]|nr:serine/threonine-protein phosphatase [Turneriella sp.]